MSQVHVFVRVRPVFYKENEEPEEACVRTSNNSSIEMINLRNTTETLKFDFQQVFNEDSSQEELFGTVVQPVLKRFTDDLQNVSIFAYGPTASGKTYTILGTDEAPGFIPRAMGHLFARVRQKDAPTQITLVMSYLEIYQEKIYDLLANSKKLDAIRQNKDGSIYIPNLTESVIDKFSDFEKLFVAASKCRRIAQTRINERSSRSHTLLIIKLTTQELTKPYRRKTAKLTIVDLAGSEDNRLTGNKGIRLKESSSINTSLHVLGKVVDALVKRQRRIPYRDSKLTRLLQDSLGGSAHTRMVVNLSPEMSCIFDTHRALSFAINTRSVINKPFTRESISVPVDLREDEENTNPHSNSATMDKAKKQKLQFDQGNNHEESDPDKSLEIKKKSSIKEEHQKVLIEEIRNSSNNFKKLQQTPKKPDTVPMCLHSPEQLSTSESPNCPSTTPSHKGQVFTIMREKNHYFLEVTATPLRM